MGVSGAGHGTPDPHPHPRFVRGWGWGSHPRFAGDRGSIPIPIPDLPGMGDHPHPRFPSGVPCPDQGPVISGSQAPLGTQGTSEISGISLNQDQGWGYQVPALISLIQHSSDNGTCWPLLPVPGTSAAAATARCCCMTMVGAPRVCVAQHRRRQHGPPRPAPAPRRAWPKQRRRSGPQNRVALKASGVAPPKSAVPSAGAWGIRRTKRGRGARQAPSTHIGTDHWRRGRITVTRG